MNEVAQQSGENAATGHGFLEEKNNVLATLIRPTKYALARWAFLLFFLILFEAKFGEELFASLGTHHPIPSA